MEKIAPAPEPVAEPEPVVEPAPAPAPDYTEEAEALTLRIYFDSDSAVIKDEYTEPAAALARFLAAHPDWAVNLEAYGDDKYGSASHNQQLSERRVASAVKKLKGAGVPDSQITTIAGGGTHKFTEGKNVKKNRPVIGTLICKK